jgi:hypothetical protein
MGRRRTNHPLAAGPAIDARDMNAIALDICIHNREEKR